MKSPKGNNPKPKKTAGAEKIILGALNDPALLALSKQMGLSLNLDEMKAIQAYYKSLKRDPSDMELECIAQTWSEHCKHKVFNSRIEYVQGKTKKVFENLFNETIVDSTEKLAKKKPWLVSVFKDNAGMIQFNSK